MSAWLPGLGLDWGRLIRLILVLAHGSVRSCQQLSAVPSQHLRRLRECLSDALTPVQSSPVTPVQLQLWRKQHVNVNVPVSSSSIAAAVPVYLTLPPACTYSLIHIQVHTHSDYIIYYLGLRQVGGSGLVMVMPLWYACRPLSRPLLRTFTALPALPALPTLLALPALPSSTRAFRLCYCTLYLLAALSTKQTSWRPCCHAAMLRAISSILLACTGQKRIMHSTVDGIRAYV